MKKFYYHLAVCLCVIGGLVGCSKEDEPGGGVFFSRSSSRGKGTLSGSCPWNTKHLLNT